MPAHNEERLVARTLARVPTFVDVVVAVDDASSDATYTEIERVADSDRRIHPLRHDRNRGVGASVVAAYKAALHLGSDVVAVMDGDGQMDPDDLPRLLDPICDGRADVAKGYRFNGLRANGPMPIARVVGNRVLSTATRVASGYEGPLDAQCGYTAVSANGLARLPLDLLYPRYGFPNDLVMRALEVGLTVESVPVRAVYASEVSGIRPLDAIPRIVGLLARGWARRRFTATVAEEPTRNET